MSTDCATPRTETVPLGETLRVTEERLRLAIEVARIALWDWDLVNDRIYLNPEWATMVGRPAEAYTAPARELAERMHPQDAERVRRAIADALKGNNTCEAVYRVRTEQGSYRWVRSQGRVVSRTADGRPMRMIGMYIDITEGQQAEAELRQARDAAQQADHAKAAFMDRVSHELRTPLNSLLGMAHLLKASPLNDRQARWAGVIDSAARDLLRQIEDVLEFSRLSRGQALPQCHEFDPARLAAQALARAERHGGKPGVVIRLVLAPQLPARLTGDAERTDQILHHLLANALKFTDSGTITVTVGAERGHDDGRPHLLLQVRDTGIGMDPSQIERLLRPFEQGDGGTARCFGGIGLGLALVDECVRALEGHIRIDSLPGQGTNVEIRLPVTDRP